MSTKSNKTVPASSFRPESYWKDPDPLAAILRNIKGTNRRKMITDFWNAGKIEELDPDNLADDADPHLRAFLEAFHPSFMGGEYLPEFLPTEVEIARIELESVTADVISIRARRQPGDELLHYRVVDEYETGFDITPESSEQPLTLAELINLIDTANGGDGGGLALAHNNYCVSDWDSVEQLRHFTRISSTIYPGLLPHYEAVLDAWLQGLREIRKHNPDLRPPTAIGHPDQAYIPSPPYQFAN